jgi:hypothetical protein
MTSLPMVLGTSGAFEISLTVMVLLVGTALVTARRRNWI